ncbi:cutinase family protein [Gordonia alkanivorans]|uniref:cutinase family protein n=1 Tax=Gordonia alkanivorans TaxID=84096 RepID=UPI0024B75018|nr:cutinase family protein [Gordonia alkanivorans]MDJ0006528.1 cutinase family protein [Gordonia alkanivorans]MDJ0492156.1 cutinase family protein [Gordonia alkanivorans]
MKRFVVTVRGIGEPMNGNMLTQFVTRLGAGWTHVEVDYPAAYGFVNGQRNPLAPDYETTKRFGRANVRIELAIIAAEHPGAIVVLAGYSAGADIVDDLAVAGVMAEFPQVKRCVVVANPSNPGSNGLADYGIAAPERGRQHVDSRVIPVNHPGDVICCCQARSPLRVIATLTPRMQLADRSVWLRDVLRKLGDPGVRAEIDRQLGAWWDPRNWGRYDRAAKDAGGYLGVGMASTHVVYRRKPLGGLSMLEHAADRVLREIGAAR